MTPQKIGRYEIKSELGRGGMATVYKAYDSRFEREVALKVLPREMLHDPQFRLRFEREAKTIAALEHPAIVPVYDVGEEDGQPYFVMRYMTGGSLQDRIAAGPLALMDAAKIIERLAPALDDAHSKGIIHRDLKPGNILFDRLDDPYLSDFGIAKITQAQGTTVTGGAIIGTPAYMSPEQAQGELVDGRSDIYALGVILYEMLSGSQPYQATTPMAVVVKHLTEPVPHILDANASLPVALEPIVEKAMAKNREMRFATAAEFCAALMAVARGESAEQALQTASITASRLSVSKTQVNAGGKTQKVRPDPTQPGGTTSPKRPWLLWILVGMGVLLVTCLLAVVAISMPLATPTQQPVVTDAATLTATLPATLAPTQPPLVPTNTVASTETSAPALPTIGGADEVALIANSEVWVMNVDGSNLTQLTADGLPKTDLQWIPGTRKLIFISGTNVNQVDADTKKIETIVSFPFAKFLDTFRLSPDGKQVAISLNREMYVVPFNLDQLKQARGKDALIAMKGCVNYMGKTEAAVHLKEFRWSRDSKIVAWLFAGVSPTGSPADLIHVVDISTCDPRRFNVLDEFPGTRFTPEGYVSNSQLPDFDWDGKSFFVFNTFDRNNGWGFLYTYNYEIRQGAQENPIATTKSHCCYRDARWSPDSTYIFLAYQNKDIVDPPTQLYFIPVSALRTGVEFKPIPMPEGFFKNPKEAPQPALHPAQP